MTKPTNWSCRKVLKVLTNVDAYEHLWRDGWEQIARALESFESGASTVEELPEANTTLVTIAPDVFEPSGFDPRKHGVPVTAVSKYARGQMFLIAIPYQTGWSYRFDYPYYSWAETVVRPHIERRDLTNLLLQLNEAERNQEAKWQRDGSEMTAAIKFLDAIKGLAASRLRPDEVAAIVRAESLSMTAGVK